MYISSVTLSIHVMVFIDQSGHQHHMMCPDMYDEETHLLHFLVNEQLACRL